jgi:hypothetical protein
LLRVQSEALAQRVNLHLALGGGIADLPPAHASAAPARQSLSLELDRKIPIDAGLTPASQR